MPYGYGRLIEQLNKQSERVIFLGDGVPVYKAMIEEKMTAPYVFAPAQMNRQRASCVAALGMKALTERLYRSKSPACRRICTGYLRNPRQKDSGRQRLHQTDRQENFREILITVYYKNWEKEINVCK